MTKRSSIAKVLSKILLTILILTSFNVAYAEQRKEVIGISVKELGLDYGETYTDGNINIRKIPREIQKNSIQRKEVIGISVKELGLNYGETYTDGNINIRKIPRDDYVDLNPEPRYTSGVIDHTFRNNQKDFCDTFKLRGDILYWKTVIDNYNYGTSLEIENITEGSYIYYVYDLDDDKYEFWGESSYPGTCELRVANGNRGLKGYVACRIADSKAGLHLWD